MVGSRLNVHLYRDSFNTPWGFRLQGGTDLNQPLIVQRVFSNSPAEGELQRGDIILSINNRDGSELTHKQAQDLIKHGGGQVQLVVQRPPPGTQVAPLSPPIVTQRPRAPSLQAVQSTPPPPLQLPQQMYYSNSQQEQAAPTHQPLHVNMPPPERKPSLTQGTITPTTPTPPWASQQPAPRGVVKLSKLGGGSSSGDGQGVYDFGLDYGTLPRSKSSSSAQYGVKKPKDESPEPENQREPDKLATGPIPKGTCSIKNLGGGGYFMGSCYTGGPSGAATLPRRSSSKESSQPKMHSAGFMPTKLTMNKFGGGAPAFGQDYGGVTTPAQSSQRPGVWQPPTTVPVPVFRPAPPPAPAPVQQTPPTWQRPPQVEDDGIPAWKSSLKNSQGSVKPWERDLYYGVQGDPVRSVQYEPEAPGSNQAPAHSPAPLSPAPPAAQAPAAAPFVAPPPAVAGEEGGPKVVHLQYNSPMGLYSQQNVEETMKGQTAAIAEAKSPPQANNRIGDRDWSQSAVLRFIEADAVSPPQTYHREGPVDETPVDVLPCSLSAIMRYDKSHVQKPYKKEAEMDWSKSAVLSLLHKEEGWSKPAPPPTAPKPQPQPAPVQEPAPVQVFDEVGASDF